ncbi:MAG: hypothetical protein ACR2PX_21760 [Endozoicomonas sp.]|uniref:hypothetical protein n=1 Tax=Endozoicomonas sp. TaxID=1892382 RepID=UPI003D9AC55E
MLSSSKWGRVIFILFSMGLPLSAKAIDWVHFARYIFQNGYWYQTGYYSIHFNESPEANAATPHTPVSDYQAYHFPAGGALAVPVGEFFQNQPSETVKKVREGGETGQCLNVPSLDPRRVSSNHVRIFSEGGQFRVEIEDSNGVKSSVSGAGYPIDAMLRFYLQKIYASREEVSSERHEGGASNDSGQTQSQQQEAELNTFQSISQRVRSQTERPGIFFDPIFGTNCQWQIQAYLNNQTHSVGWHMLSAQAPAVILLPVFLEPAAQFIPLENHPIVQGLENLGGSLENPPGISAIQPASTVNSFSQYEMSPEFQAQGAVLPSQPINYENVPVNQAITEQPTSDDTVPPEPEEAMTETIFNTMDIQFTDILTHFQTDRFATVASMIRDALGDADLYERDETLEQISQYLQNGRANKDPEVSAKADRLLKKALRGQLSGFRLFGISVVPKTCKDGDVEEDYRRDQDDDEDENQRRGSFSQKSTSPSAGYVRFCLPEPAESNGAGFTAHDSQTRQHSPLSGESGKDDNHTYWEGTRSKLIDQWLEARVYQLSQTGMEPLGSSGALPSSTH